MHRRGVVAGKTQPGFQRKNSLRAFQDMDYNNLSGGEEPDNFIENRTFVNRICHRMFLFIFRPDYNNFFYYLPSKYIELNLWLRETIIKRTSLCSSSSQKD
jgi:hypothetical protein